MNPAESKSKKIPFRPLKPVPRILITQTVSKKWIGCIYLSTSDLTGQILELLKDLKKDSTLLFLKNPIFVFVSAEKAEVETRISEKINSLLKTK